MILPSGDEIHLRIAKIEEEQMQGLSGVKPKTSGPMKECSLSILRALPEASGCLIHTLTWTCSI